MISTSKGISRLGQARRRKSTRRNAVVPWSVELLETRTLLTTIGLTDVQFTNGSAVQTGPAVVGSTGDHWNAINVASYGSTLSIPSIALTNVTGASNGVSVSVSSTFALSTLTSSDSAFVGTAYQNLMQVGLIAGVPVTVTFTGLPTNQSFDVIMASAGSATLPTSTAFFLNSNFSTSLTAHDYNTQIGFFVQGTDYAVYSNASPDSTGKLTIEYDEDTSLNAILNGIQLQPAGALVFTQGPINTTAGTPNQLTVDLKNQANATVSDGSAVSLLIQGPIVGGNIGNIVTVTGDDSQIPGQYVFTLPAITQAGFYDIGAVDVADGYSQFDFQGNQEYINVTPGPAAQLFFLQQPTNITPGSNFSPTVRVTLIDSYGNNINDGTNVDLEIFSGSGTLTGTTQAQIVSDVATFSSAMTISTAGTYTLDASDGDDSLGAPYTTPFVSNPFTVAAVPIASALINIDFTDASIVQSGAAEIGAAGDAWNGIPISSASHNGVAPLFDSNHNISSASLAYFGTLAEKFAPGGFANLTAAALGGNSVAQFNNIPNQTYNLYLYSAGIAGDTTAFQVQGQIMPATPISPETSFVAGQDYVEFPNVSVTTGSLVISDAGLGGPVPALLNAIQLQPATTVITPLSFMGTIPHYLKYDPATSSLIVYNNSTGTGISTEYPKSGLTSIIVNQTGNVNDSLTIDFSAGNPLPSGGLSFDGGGTSLTAGAQLNLIGTTGNDTITASFGFVLFGSTPITYTNIGQVSLDPNGGDDSVTVLSGTLALAPHTANTGLLTWDFSQLAVGPGARLAVIASLVSANRVVLVTPDLSIYHTAAGWYSQLDLNNNELIVQSPNTTNIQSQLASGFNGGNWEGFGIVSSASQFSYNPATTLGMLTIPASGLFDQQPVSAGDVVVKFTYYGDIDLNGIVDGSDYSRIDYGYLQKLTGLNNGDLNFDNTINGSDYTLIDNAYNSQGASLAAQIAPKADASGVIDSIVLPAAVFSDLQVRNTQITQAAPQVGVAAEIFATDSDDLLPRRHGGPH